MAKTNQIKKLVNGEIADADDVNQIVENAGTEGGLIPYSDADQQRDDLGAEDIGSTNFPFGNMAVNQEMELREINTSSPSVASSVQWKNLRRFLYLKDTPDSYTGFGGNTVRVKSDESGLEFLPLAAVETFSPTGSPHTWVCPVGINSINTTACAGGGGGGGGHTSNANAGEGGGGGESVAGHVYKVTPGNSYTFTVGAGGTAGATGASPTDGGDGGNTSIAGGLYTLTLTGGQGGDSNGDNAKGAGAIGSLEAMTALAAMLAGVDGGGTRLGGKGTFSGGNGGDSASANGGGGGGSMLASGGLGGSDGVAGVNGGPGAGGGGGGRAGDGGVGGSGLIIIHYAANA